jgi:NAD(P)-dependent dehydrogenase (short-subunit alcohol dehydrogenase family)
MQGLKDKVAVVTGSTQGLGAAIAKLFIERGAKGVVICGRNAVKGEAQAKALNALGKGRAAFVKADLAKVEDCRAVVGRADAEFGRLDILVNAGASTARGTILDTTPDAFDAMMATNVRGPFFLMQEAVKLMKRDQVQGAIVNIGSMSAKAGQPFLAAYCLSKGALATLTENTAYGLLRNRIRVNQLNIGWMASDGEDQIQRGYHKAPADWLEQASKHQPNGRLIDPDEVARAVAFLASDESGLMTGSVVNFDQSIWGAYDSAPAPADAM